MYQGASPLDLERFRGGKLTRYGIAARYDGKKRCLSGRCICNWISIFVSYRLPEPFIAIDIASPSSFNARISSGPQGALVPQDDRDDSRDRRVIEGDRGKAVKDQPRNSRSGSDVGPNRIMSADFVTSSSNERHKTWYRNSSRLSF